MLKHAAKAGHLVCGEVAGFPCSFGRKPAAEMAGFYCSTGLLRVDHTQHPGVAGDLIHHSDAGKQVTQRQNHWQPCAAGHPTVLGSIGEAYDNALMGSIKRLYTTECIGSRVFAPERLELIVDIEIAPMLWVEVVYHQSVALHCGGWSHPWSARRCIWPEKLQFLSHLRR